MGPRETAATSAEGALQIALPPSDRFGNILSSDPLAWDKGRCRRVRLTGGPAGQGGPPEPPPSPFLLPDRLLGSPGHFPSGGDATLASEGGPPNPPPNSLRSWKLFLFRAGTRPGARGGETGGAFRATGGRRRPVCPGSQRRKFSINWRPWGVHGGGQEDPTGQCPESVRSPQLDFSSSRSPIYIAGLTTTTRTSHWPPGGPERGSARSGRRARGARRNRTDLPSREKIFSFHAWQLLDSSHLPGGRKAFGQVPAGEGGPPKPHRSPFFSRSRWGGRRPDGTLTIRDKGREPGRGPVGGACGRGGPAEITPMSLLQKDVDFSIFETFSFFGGDGANMTGDISGKTVGPCPRARGGARRSHIDLPSSLRGTAPGRDFDDSGFGPRGLNRGGRPRARGGRRNHTNLPSPKNFHFFYFSFLRLFRWGTAPTKNISGQGTREGTRKGQGKDLGSMTAGQGGPAGITPISPSSKMSFSPFFIFETFSFFTTISLLQENAHFFYHARTFHFKWWNGAGPNGPKPLEKARQGKDS